MSIGKKKNNNFYKEGLIIFNRYFKIKKKDQTVQSDGGNVFCEEDTTLYMRANQKQDALFFLWGFFY